MVCFIRPTSTTGCGITSDLKKPKLGKLLAAFFAFLLVGLTIFAFLIPREFTYTKEVEVVAQDRMVFVFLGDLKRWNEWSVWAKKDPNNRIEYSDPAWGEGSWFKWKSDKLGEGEVRVTQFTRTNSVSYDLLIPGFDPSKWEYRMRPHPRQGVIVNWTVNGLYPENRFWRLIAYIMMWGLPKDMEEGLANLKKHAEAHEAYDVMGDWEKPQPK